MFLSNYISKKVAALKERIEYNRQKRRANSKKRGYYYMKENTRRIQDLY